MNDQEAIVLLKSDSHEAFEYLYKVYGGQVYNFSKLYINSSEDIKEVVQEVFVKLWEARSFLREDENFRGFLFIVTRNLIFNRQKKTFNENFYKLSVLSAYEQSNIDSYNIEEELQAKELFFCFFQICLKPPISSINNNTIDIFEHFLNQKKK